MAAEELFAVMLERALRLGYWDGVEPITASVLGSRVPVHFFANCNEAALTGRDGFQPLPADEARACDCPPGSIQKIEARGPVGETDDMALAGIVSTQLVHHQFVSRFRIRPTLAGDDDVKVCVQQPATATN